MNLRVGFSISAKKTWNFDPGCIETIQITLDGIAILISHVLISDLSLVSQFYFTCQV